MARKNPFANLIDTPSTPNQEPSAPNYVPQGAARSVSNSIVELANQADQLLEGETIIELDPALIDDSFAKDRFTLDDQDYEEELARVLEAVRERGQDTPVLVRPHPTQSGRYMLVFGHVRRLTAAKLGRKVRAVVKEMSDRDHVIAQGQENNSRSNTSFIEKAMFAADIVSRRFDDDNSTVMAALGVNKPTLSKMIAVASLPEPLLKAIGRAKRVGRDRWYDLKLLLDRPSNLDEALGFVVSSAFAGLPSDDRFEALFGHLKSKKSGPGRRPAEVKAAIWTPSDGRIAAEAVSRGAKFTLAIKAKGTDAQAFGEYLTEHLDQLYEGFRQQNDQLSNGE